MSDRSPQRQPSPPTQVSASRGARARPVGSDQAARGGPLAGLQSTAGNAAVGRMIEGKEGPRSVEEIALSGFQGPRSPLPYQSEMERAFDASLGRVEAHTDAHASRASHCLQAEAYTFGHRIAFGSHAPSREVVAHEVAHTLQQEPSLKRGTPRSTQSRETISESYEGEAEVAEHAISIPSKFAMLRRISDSPMSLMMKTANSSSTNSNQYSSPSSHSKTKKDSSSEVSADADSSTSDDGLSGTIDLFNNASALGERICEASYNAMHLWCQGMDESGGSGEFSLAMAATFITELTAFLLPKCFPAIGFAAPFVSAALLYAIDKGGKASEPKTPEDFLAPVRRGVSDLRKKCVTTSIKGGTQQSPSNSEAKKALVKILLGVESNVDYSDSESIAYANLLVTQALEGLDDEAFGDDLRRSFTLSWIRASEDGWDLDSVAGVVWANQYWSFRAWSFEQSVDTKHGALWETLQFGKAQTDCYIDDVARADSVLHHMRTLWPEKQPLPGLGIPIRIKINVQFDVAFPEPAEYSWWLIAWIDPTGNITISGGNINDKEFSERVAHAALAGSPPRIGDLATDW